jgi:peptidoglycan/LPS O-acetylase OafA/YrhL
VGCIVMASPSVSPLPDRLAYALKQANLPSIDGLRAVAVMLVVLYHFGLRINGGLGVTIFFVVSGFLITWLLLKEESKWGGISLRLFYLRRSLRIFPAFYAFWFLVVVILGVMAGKPVVWPHAITAFFYVGNYYQAIANEWVTPLFHTWSLAIEEQFYLLWPAAFIALRNNASRVRALLVGIPCIWAYRLLLVWLGVGEQYIYASLETRADHLLIGCLLALLLYENMAGRLWSVLSASSWSIFITFSLLAISSAVTVVRGYLYRDTLGFIVDPLLTVVLLVQAMSLAPGWLNWAPVRYVGRISYSVYLYHMLAVALAAKLFGKLPLIIHLTGAVILVLLAASLSYYVIERPVLKLKDRIGQRRESATAAPTVAA